MIDLLESVKSISSVNLTVRAQELSPTNNGTLIWNRVMPRDNVDSTVISELVETDFRPVGARRDWNANGQRLTFRPPSEVELEFTPIENDTLIDEQELDKLDRRYDGNQQMMLNRLKVTIPQRTDSLVDMAYRKLEADVIDAWTKGTVTQKDPQTNRTYVGSYGFETGRIQTAGTAWNTSTAYTNFIAWLKDGRSELLGGIYGAMASSLVIETIIDAAPVLANGMRMNIDEFNADIRSRVGFPFVFVPNDEEADFPDEGGDAYTRRRFFAEGAIALIPRDGRVGRTAFAPVRRARALAASVPEARIDIRGASVFTFGENDNKALKIQAQLNAFPVPNEKRVWVMNTGIS